MKKQKPNNPFYHQGMYDSKKFKKIFESCKKEPTIYRSGLEKDFIQYCESEPSILRWGSEPLTIKYFCRLDNKFHEYFPDFIIETSKGDKIIIEIKPYSQTQKPKSTDNAYTKQTWIKNVDKWNEAKKFAEHHGMKFLIITERFFYGN